MKIQKIIEDQKAFQRLIGYPVDSKIETDKHEMAEKHLFKMIEECIEVRKEFPSVMNPWAKIQKKPDLNRIKEEMADVFLFFVNILSIWEFGYDDFLDKVIETQDNNFIKLKEKQNVSDNKQTTTSTD